MDVDLDKELKVRRRILAIYNKDREDFASKQEFDDYLEEVEDIIWRLSNNVDIERTEAQIRKYRQQNQEQINAKSARQANMDAHTVATQLTAASLAAAAAQAAKVAAPLMSGGLPTILPRLVQDDGTVLDGGRNFKYDRRLPDRVGPEVEAAGGWTAAVARTRLMQEAFSSLLLPSATRILVEGTR
ncbi:hypothetical protein VOLCADRAFT_105507 [Volvox carteri f. nagariensis]|uniref:MAT1 centre domain-containing protein n=1 Tax=Volvox carteri f. nagariensis TaxID=3068 RepID=D8U1A9_VOLCA|nr:uncharacterized protein VOLCADRAFT_105507 [Volvox carteri f. nagariensis]EFJ46524.1 hypothetical protein VOLCADRAFT_105507 [Volvox carteri f. nagariensis]|eukprot:XP_002952381.1 hypothetical protein VOLCADRAFT_105507 [Volvox carteri f. nagariensis]